MTLTATLGEIAGISPPPAPSPRRKRQRSRREYEKRIAWLVSVNESLRQEIERLKSERTSRRIAHAEELRRARHVADVATLENKTQAVQRLRRNKRPCRGACGEWASKHASGFCRSCSHRRAAA